MADWVRRFLRFRVRHPPVRKPVACPHCIRGQLYLESYQQRRQGKRFVFHCLQCGRIAGGAYWPRESLEQRGIPAHILDRIELGWSSFCWLRSAAKVAAAVIETEAACAA